MSESIVLRTEQDGVEFYTVASSGESGMSQRGLAKLCGVHHRSIQYILDSLAKNKASKWLKPCVDKDLYLMGEFTKNGGEIKIIRAEICSSIIKHFAFTGHEEAQYALEKFTEIGINTWIQEINQWKQPVVHKLPEELMVEYAVALLERKREILALQAENQEIKAEQQATREFLISHHNRLEITEENQEKTDKEVANIKAEVHRYSNGTGDFYSILGWARRNGHSVSLKKSNSLGRKASALCRKQGVTPEPTGDVRFGLVNSYPEFILEQLDFSIAA